MPTTFVDQNGNYYETITDVPAKPGHTEVPKRPDPLRRWDGNAWVRDQAAENADRAEQAALRQRQIDDAVDRAKVMAKMLGITVSDGELRLRAAELYP